MIEIDGKARKVKMEGEKATLLAKLATIIRILRKNEDINELNLFDAIKFGFVSDEIIKGLTQERR